MAGGMGRGGVPLHARSRAGGATSGSPAEASPATSASGCPARHCWVRAPVDAGEPRAGLLLEWRRTGTGRWQGRVVYAAQLRPGEWGTVEEWLAAELLSSVQ